MVAQVAALEPLTAAKMVQPMMLVCSSRPGRRESHGARPLNMSSDRRVRNRISPIHTKSGNAVSVHDDAVPQIVTAIASPAGRDANSDTISSVVTTASFMMQRFAGDARAALAVPLQHHLVDERDQQHRGADRH